MVCGNEHSMSHHMHSLFTPHSWYRSLLWQMCEKKPKSYISLNIFLTHFWHRLSFPFLPCQNASLTLLQPHIDLIKTILHSVLKFFQHHNTGARNNVPIYQDASILFVIHVIVVSFFEDISQLSENQCCLWMDKHLSKQITSLKPRFVANGCHAYSSH